MEKEICWILITAEKLEAVFEHCDGLRVLWKYFDFWVDCCDCSNVTPPEVLITFWPGSLVLCVKTKLPSHFQDSCQLTSYPTWINNSKGVRETHFYVWSEGLLLSGCAPQSQHALSEANATSSRRWKNGKITRLHSQLWKHHVIVLIGL